MVEDGFVDDADGGDGGFAGLAASEYEDVFGFAGEEFGLEAVGGAVCWVAQGQDFGRGRVLGPGPRVTGFCCPLFVFVGLVLCFQRGLGHWGDAAF